MNGEQEVFFELNGQPRSIFVRNETKSKVTSSREKATADIGSVGGLDISLCFQIFASDLFRIIF